METFRIPKRISYADLEAVVGEKRAKELAELVVVRKNMGDKMPSRIIKVTPDQLMETQKLMTGQSRLHFGRKGSMMLPVMRKYFFEHTRARNQFLEWIETQLAGEVREAKEEAVAS